MQGVTKRKQKPQAFTMVELLVVITIVAVLAVLAFAMMRRSLDTVKRASCANNMRQIGSALGIYMGERSTLPHCWVSTPCNPRPADPDDFGPLSGHLAGSLGYPGASRADRVFLPEFQCPAYPRQMSEQEAIESGWHVTYRLVLGKAGGKNPFGGRADSKPFRLLSVESKTGRSPATFPVVFDMDQQLGLHHGGAPETPVHGSGRNVLYLDGHVEFETDLGFVEGFR